MKYLAEFNCSDIFKYPLSSSHKHNNDIGCFYAIKNISNNKIYIGQTKSFYNRMRSHIYNSRRNKGILIDKNMYNNIDDFRFYILITFKEKNINFFTRKNITIIEQYLIKEYNSKHPYGYNERIYT
jgi:hypothetical protein